MEIIIEVKMKHKNVIITKAEHVLKPGDKIFVPFCEHGFPVIYPGVKNSEKVSHYTFGTFNNNNK